MNLYELIQQIPNFIQETVIKGRERKDMIGRFHLGLNYDMLLWLSNRSKRCSSKSRTKKDRSRSKSVRR